MDYLMTGNPKEVQKVLRENRIRIERGVIKFTPVQAKEAPQIIDTNYEQEQKMTAVEETDAKAFEAIDVKEVESTDEKDIKNSDTKEVEVVDEKNIDNSDTEEVESAEKTVKKRKKKME